MPTELTTPPAPEMQARDPRRYFEEVGEARSPLAVAEPVCLYLETTNRCNLLCTTCPRTYEDLEPPADMSWELFTRIVDQYPNLSRVVLHGIGEPMMVKELPFGLMALAVYGPRTAVEGTVGWMRMLGLIVEAAD